MSEPESPFAPFNFRHQKLFQEKTRDFIFRILKESYINLMRDGNVRIHKNNELKCSVQLVYFAIQLRNVELYPFRFESEAQYGNIEEIVYGEENPKTSSRIDIKISKSDWDEESFITVECKRLNKGRTLIKKYVDEGMDRFISGKYCLDNNCSFMVGFIIDGDNLQILAALNKYVKEKHSGQDVLKEIEPRIKYFSNHDRAKGHTPFSIYHLLANIDKLTI